MNNETLMKRLMEQVDSELLKLTPNQIYLILRITRSLARDNAKFNGGQTQ